MTLIRSKQKKRITKPQWGDAPSLNSWPTCWSWALSRPFFYAGRVRFVCTLRRPLLHSTPDRLQEHHKPHLENEDNGHTADFRVRGALSPLKPTGRSEPCRRCLWKLCSACGKSFSSTWRMSCRVVHRRGQRTGAKALAGDTTALPITHTHTHTYIQNKPRASLMLKMNHTPNSGPTSGKRAPFLTSHEQSPCWWWRWSRYRARVSARKSRSAGSAVAGRTERPPSTRPWCRRRNNLGSKKGRKKKKRLQPVFFSVSVVFISISE